MTCACNIGRGLRDKGLARNDFVLASDLLFYQPLKWTPITNVTLHARFSANVLGCICVARVSVCRPAVFILLSSERRLQIVSECVMEKPVESYATLTYECMRVAPYVCQ